MDIANMMEGHDRRIRGILAEHVEAVAEMRPDINLDELRAFIRSELIPHFHAEELHILTSLDAVREVGVPATAAMSIDLAEIKKCAHRIENPIFALETAPIEDVAVKLWAELRVSLIELQALVRLHMRKVEEVYAPALDERMTDAQKHRTIAEMEVEVRLEALAHS